jgi:peptidoglycan/LPS O-acetylase OafA/YrhL
MEYALSPKRSAAPTFQLPSLTPLRGLAALWVVLFHYTALYFPNLDITNSYTHLIGKGYLAVDLFFLLSGFVMTHVYHKAFSEGARRHYRDFLVARIARLYPLHVLVLCLFVIVALCARIFVYMKTGAPLGIPFTGPRSFTAFIANLLMLHGIAAGELSWNYPAWSISVEFMAYLAFPFVLPLIWRARSTLQLALFPLLAAALVVFAYLADGDFNQWDGPIVLLRCLPEFTLGTLLYCAYRRGTFAAFLARDDVAVALVLVLIVALHFAIPDLLIVPLFAALILAAVANDATFARVLNVAPLIWLGDISYSLYLLHGFYQYGATKCLTAFGVRDRATLSPQLSLGLAIMMVGACLISAHVTYFGIEIGWRKHLRTVLGSRAPARKRTPQASGERRPANRTT